MSRCTTTPIDVLSIKQSHMPDDTTNRELSDEELEMVVGGQSHETFEHWRCEIINALNYEALKEDERQYNS